jgi:cell division septation protein DedD
LAIGHGSRTYQFVAAIWPDLWNRPDHIVNYDFCSFRDFSFAHYSRQTGAVMAIEQLENFLVRSDPVEADPFEPALLPETFVYEQRKHGQTTPGGSANNRLRIRTVLNICTGRRARRLFRRGSWVLLVGGVAYLVFLALINEGRPVDQAPIIPAGPQQAIVPADQQPATPSRPVHGAPPEERSFYGLASAPPAEPIAPVKNSPLASPELNTGVSANDGGYVVQVSAERSDTKAQASFKTLQSRYPNVLGDRSPLIRRVELGGKGIFYRAQIGPFDTAEKAQQLCARLKSAGGHCMVQKNFSNTESTERLSGTATSGALVR